jgi:hypothetical protein
MYRDHASLFFFSFLMISLDQPHCAFQRFGQRRYLDALRPQRSRNNPMSSLDGSRWMLDDGTYCVWGLRHDCACMSYESTSSRTTFFLSLSVLSG